MMRFAMATVRALEEKIFDLEQVVVKIRAPLDAEVDDYGYERKAAASTSVSDWLESRIKPLVKGHEVAIIGGNYTTPHGRTKLGTLRESYAK
jgi:hypothetical protein